MHASYEGVTKQHIMSVGDHSEAKALYCQDILDLNAHKRLLILVSNVNLA